MKCLVTGATGFVGRRLCTLLKHRGHEVVPFSRHGAALPDGTSTQALDLTQSIPSQLMSTSDIDVVFHLAGIAHQKALPAQYDVLNYRATSRLARAAAESGVGQFIFVSSVKAMGAARGVAPRTESDLQLPQDAYGLSKWRAELAVREVSGQTGMPVSIIRPTLVYGIGVKGNLRLLAKAARLGLPRPPAGGRRSMIALDDLTELLMQVADAEPRAGNTWIATSEDHSTQALYDLLRQADDKAIGRQWAPDMAWRLGGRLLDTFGGGSGDSTYNKLFSAELYDNSAILAATTWRPTHTFAQAASTLLGSDVE